MTFNGVIGSGSGGVSKVGAGKTTFTNTNTYSGVNTLSSGTLSVSAVGELGTGTTNSIVFPTSSTGILQLTGTFSSGVKTVLLSGNGTIDVPNASDTCAFTGGGFSGIGNLTKTGAGTLNMAVANTLTGSVIVNGGVFLLGNATALGPAATASVVFGPNMHREQLRLGGISPTVTAINTNAIVGTPVIENNSTTAATLTTVNNISPAASTFAGVLQDGAASGALALTKNGTGTFTFSGSGTNSGATTVNQGNSGGRRRQRALPEHRRHGQCGHRRQHHAELRRFRRHT